MILEKADKERIIKLADFLQREVGDFPKFKRLSWKEYQTDNDQRRNIERWVENVVNSSIDIAKIILAADKVRIPQTYKDILHNLGATHYFKDSLARKLSQWAKLRNIVTHEYLDIRWESIKEFVEESEPVYLEFLKIIKKQVIK